MNRAPVASEKVVPNKQQCTYPTAPFRRDPAEMPGDQNSNKESVERRQDTQSPTKVKVLETNIPSFIELLKKQRGNQESADDKKYGDPEVAISEIGKRGFIPAIVAIQGMSDQHHRDGYR